MIMIINDKDEAIGDRSRKSKVESWRVLLRDAVNVYTVLLWFLIGPEFKQVTDNYSIGPELYRSKVSLSMSMRSLYNLSN